MRKRVLAVVAVVGGSAALLSASASGRQSVGTPVALVTAETENELLAVSLPNGQIVRRVSLPADPENVAAEGAGAVAVSSKGHAVTLLGPSLRVRKIFRHFSDPHMAAIAPDGEWAYVSDDGNGVLSVIELSNARIVRRVFVGVGAHHLSFRPDEKQLWVALGEHARRIVVVDTTSPNRPRVIARFEPGFPAHDLSFSPDGRRVWVTSDGDNRVRVFDARTRRVLFTVDGGPPPQHVAFARGGLAYVTSGYGSRIESVNGLTGKVVRRVASPYGSFNVATIGRNVVVSSLLRGSVTYFTGRLRVLRTVHVAPSARDVAASFWP